MNFRVKLDYPGPKWGVFEPESETWAGDEEGPFLFAKSKFAIASARIATIRTALPHESRLFPHEIVTKKDEKEYPVSLADALRKILNEPKREKD